MKHCVACGVVAICVGLLAGSRAFGQGNLTPPGAPGTTMKSLTEIYQRQVLTEPRIPITNAPYAITKSGSYYLTTNLTVSGDALDITTSNVVVDLMGYALSENATGYGVSLTGVTNNPLVNITIRNGTIRGFAFGVCAVCVNYSQFSDLVVIDNAGHGIQLDGSSGGPCLGNLIANCKIVRSGSVGLELVATPNGRCSANTIENCQILANTNNGVDFNRAPPPMASSPIRWAPTTGFYATFVPARRITSRSVAPTCTDLS